MSGRGKGLGKRTREPTKIELPVEAAIPHLEIAALRAADERLTSHAYDLLPQLDDVCEGDWYAAGYRLETSFPTFVKLREKLEELEKKYEEVLESHQLRDKLHDSGYRFVLPEREDLDCNVEETTDEMTEDLIEEWWLDDDRDSDFGVLDAALSEFKKNVAALLASKHVD